MSDSLKPTCSCGDRARPHINHRKRIDCYTFIGPNRYAVKPDGSYVRVTPSETGASA